jgi:hypothetical protein
MNERQDDIDLVTEERLRRAVRFRDAEVITSPDALDRVRSRASEQRMSPGWQRPGVLLGAAAALVFVIGGLAVAFRTGDETPDVTTDAATDATTDATIPDTAEPADDAVTPPSSTLLPSTTSTSPPTTTYPPLPDLTPRQRADLGLIVWPLDSRSFQDPSTVAFSYITQALGIDDPVFETELLEDGLATVTIALRAEDGTTFGEAARLDLVALDQFNWVIVRAESPEVVLTSIVFEGEGLATVVGVGRAFEGAARIVARSVCDPEGVITPVTVGGGPEFDTFTQTAAFVPCPDLPVVIELATDVIIEDGVPFVSAVAYLEPDLELSWSVMRVPADDVLIVRSGPGVSNEIVAELAPDATGIEIVGNTGESVGDQLWREIVTPNGISGWVDFAYLTAQAELTAATAEALALETLAFLSSDAVDSTVLGPRGVYVGGIGVFADAATPFLHVDSGALSVDEVSDWSPIPDDAECGDECQLSARQFLDAAEIVDRVHLPVALDQSKDLSLEDQFLYGPIDQLSLFESLHSMTIEVPATNAGDLDWRLYHLWFDWADGTPRVIAVWRWGWTP